MKRLLLVLGSFALVALVALAGCGGGDAGPSRPPRADWRHQAPVCSSDDQCPSGACVMPEGQTRGTCAPGSAGESADPSLPPGHPPRRPHDPEEPTVKPQPGDIQL